ncbi:MAG TPA: hypothetical protein VNK96_07000 [Fimbriimonadales bacterium]|nr:hypothetical protein [Fimbriimonadales bacterium]
MRLAVLSLALFLFTVSQAQFQGDSRLEKPLDVRAEAEQLGTVIERISNDVNVKLYVEGSLRGDLVILYVKQRPASEILSTIAEHFGWKWEKEGDGYRLFQPTESRAKEQRLLKEQILEPYKLAQQAAKKYLEQVAKADKEKLENELKLLDERMQTLRNEGDRNAYLSVWHEYERIYQLLYPLNHLTLKAFSSLSEQQLLELDSRSRIVLALRPSPAQHPLRDVQKEIEAAVQHLIEWREGIRKLLKERMQELRLQERSVRSYSQKDVANIRIEIFREREMNEERFPYMRITLLDSEGYILHRANAYLNEVFLKYAPSIEAKAREKNRLDELRIESEDLRHPSERDKLEIRKEFFTIGNKRDPLAPWAHTFCEIAAAARINLIGDLYDLGGDLAWDTGYWFKPTKNNAGMMLDELTSISGQTWRLEGEWVKLRHKKWALARFSTVPRNILFASRDTMLTKGGLALDDLAAIAAQLNDRQAESKVIRYATKWHWPSGEQALYVLRLWNSLNNISRKALLGGEVIAFAQLPPQARRYYSEVVFRLGAFDFFFFIDSPDPEVVEEMQFQKERWGYDETQAEDREITQRFPQGPLFDSTLDLKVIVREGLTELYGGTSSLGNFSSFLAQFEEESQEYNLIRSEMVRPAVINKYFFTFQLQPGFAGGVVIDTSLSDPKAPFVKLSSLPEETIKKIKEMEAKYRKWRKEKGWG